MEITFSWKKRVEKVFNADDMPPSPRRLNRHARTGVTKKGNKKRSLRGQSATLLDEEGGSEDEDEDDVWPLDGGRPPALSVHLPLRWIMEDNHILHSARVKLGDYHQPLKRRLGTKRSAAKTLLESFQAINQITDDGKVS